jgi:protocatechuate 3,4-dioxygenase beta subunit
MVTIYRLIRNTLFIPILFVFVLSACNSAATQPADATTTQAETDSDPTSPPAASTETASGSSREDQYTEPQESDADPTAAVPQTACTPPAAVTPSATEGPYYSPGSPERADLFADGMPGTQLVLSGYVLTADCQPVANAWLDFWQADANGNYDNAGYNLRGHQFSDENGFYQLITVVPGIYPGRTEHIHFKAQAPEGAVLTSQLFFPGSESNQGDNIFDPGLLIDIQESADGLLGTFNIILP